MDAVALLLVQIQHAHQWLEATLEGITETQAHWIPPGSATPLGATYAHVVCAEDLFINGLLRQATPLLASTGAAQTGLSEPMPTPDNWTDYGPWTRRVKIDLSEFRRYAQAVYKATEDYLEVLTPEQLDETMDLSNLGWGTVSLGWFIGRLVIGHLDNGCGEISCLKGLQGIQGYPS